MCYHSQAKLQVICNRCTVAKKISGWATCWKLKFGERVFSDRSKDLAMHCAQHYTSILFYIIGQYVPMTFTDLKELFTAQNY